MQGDSNLQEFVCGISYRLHMNTPFVYKKTEEHGNADALGRGPLQVISATTEMPPEWKS